MWLATDEEVLPWGPRGASEVGESTHHQPGMGLQEWRKGVQGSRLLCVQNGPLWAARLEKVRLRRLPSQARQPPRRASSAPFFYRHFLRP